MKGKHGFQSMQALQLSEFCFTYEGKFHSSQSLSTINAIFTLVSNHQRRVVAAVNAEYSLNQIQMQHLIELDAYLTSGKEQAAEVLEKLMHLKYHYSAMGHHSVHFIPHQSFAFY